VGKGMAHMFVTLLIGMVLGAIIALQRIPTSPAQAPGRGLFDRLHLLVPGVSQHRLRADQDFAAQHRVHRHLPGGGAAAVRHHLPLTKTLIVLTFLLGLLPVIGNLMSNTLITIVGLSLSIWVAVAALGYLIVIHKLEYFLNARIVGGQISAKSWELLLAMLVFEAAFGLPGVAGPIYYAYLKSELKRMELV
jgi:hypothetical protein